MDSSGSQLEGKVARMDFQLFAPHVERVELIGSWLKDPVSMQKDETGTWRTSSDVPDGRNTYRFRLPSQSPFNEGKTVEVTDPFARVIDESDHDAGVIVFKDGQDVTTAYDWQHDDKPLPQDDELVIYELHVGEFGWKDDHQGTFLTVIERLDYLRDLGVNAIEFMPITEFPFEQSWGYNVRHACALKEAYGSPQDFKRLVDECHVRGMRVILDIVFNHTESESPLSQIDFYYWFRDSRPDEQSFGPKFDYERVDDTLEIDGQKVMPARKHGLEVALYWLREYHIDGYRLDATAILNNFDFVRMVRQECKGAADGKPFYIVAEQIPEDPSIAGPDAPADGAWHQRFENTVINVLKSNGDHAGELLETLQPMNHGYVSPARVVNYVESHDEFTMMQKLAEAGIMDETAFRKAKLAATFLFTAVGNPMLYQGQEFGGYRVRDLEIRPLQWELLEADFGLHLKEHYAWLAKTRHGSPALKGEEFEVVHNDAGIIAYRRGFGQSEVIVVVNLMDDERTATIRFLDGAWRELGFAYDIDSGNGQLADTFPASGAKIYVRR
jgi:1,4-alpha-glucan branching enzyme